MTTYRVYLQDRCLGSFGATTLAAARIHADKLAVAADPIMGFRWTLAWTDADGTSNSYHRVG